MKKILLYLSTLMLALVLVACGSDEESNSAPENKTETATTTAAPAEPEEKDEVEKESKSEKGKFYADALTEDLPIITEDYLELSQASYDFIASNNDILPANTPEAIEKVKGQAQTVDMKLINKNVSPYYSTITTYEGEVLQIEETNHENGETAAWVNIYDDAGNSHILYIYKSTGDILEEDYVQFWGIPVGAYSYDTLDGGFQNAQVYFGAHIEKK